MLSSDSIVELWSPSRFRVEPTPPDPFTSLGTVPIFDITGRSTARLRQHLDSLPVRIPTPEELRRQEEAREDKEFELLRDGKTIRDRYNEVQGHLVELKYACLGKLGLDLTIEHVDAAASLLSLIEGSSQRGEYTLSERDRAFVLPRLDWIDLWIGQVGVALDGLSEWQGLLLEAEEWRGDIDDLLLNNLGTKNRKNLIRSCEDWKIPLQKSRAKLDETILQIRFVETSQTDLVVLDKVLRQVQGKLGEIRKHHKAIHVLGGTVEDSLPSTVIRAPKITLSDAEQRVVDAWRRVTGDNRASAMENQVRKIVTTGDFTFLRELTDLIDYIQRNRSQSSLRYRGVDIVVHALKGKLSGNVSYDFPFLNKTRLGSNNRGVWRIIFHGTLIAGIYDDHNGSLVGWKGEGTQATRIP